MIEPFDDFESAIDRVNDSDFGLQAGVFTGSLTNAMRAWDALDVGGVRSSAGRAAIAQLHVALSDPHNLSNPGTTADITTAAIFVTLLTGGWHSRHGGSDAAPR